VSSIPDVAMTFLSRPRGVSSTGFALGFARALDGFKLARVARAAGVSPTSVAANVRIVVRGVAELSPATGRASASPAEVRAAADRRRRFGDGASVSFILPAVVLPNATLVLFVSFLD
jgi:hypothetical protein